MTNSSNRLSSLSKQSHLMLGGFAAAAGVLASGSASAELIIQNIDQTASNGSIFLDVNGDWVNDFEITSFEVGAEFPSEGGVMVKKPKVALKSFAIIKGIKNSGKLMSFDSVEVEMKQLFPGTTGRVLIDTSQPDFFVERLNPGDSVSGASGKFDVFGSLYQGENDEIQPEERALVEPAETINGPFSEIGDTGYIGLSLTFGEDICCDFELSTVELLEIDEPYIEEQPLEVYYGWAEVVRGSLQVIRIGFQSTPFTAAQIPGGSIGVSEPATLPLIALGAAGLMGLRRRKNKAA